MWCPLQGLSAAAATRINDGFYCAHDCATASFTYWARIRPYYCIFGDQVDGLVDAMAHTIPACSAGSLGIAGSWLRCGGASSSDAMSHEHAMDAHRHNVPTYVPWRR